MLGMNQQYGAQPFLQEGNQSSATPEILCLSRNPEYITVFVKFPNLDRNLNHTNQVNFVINCSFKIRFHMHLPSLLRSSNQFLSSSFSELKFLSIPLVLVFR